MPPDRPSSTGSSGSSGSSHHHHHHHHPPRLDPRLTLAPRASPLVYSYNACKWHLPTDLTLDTTKPNKQTVPAKLEFLELYETPTALLLLGTDRQRVCTCMCICMYTPTVWDHVRVKSTH